MKKIGLIGGMGPESTVMYYRDIINRYHGYDDQNTPVVIIYSINLEEMFRLQEAGDEKGQLDMLTSALHVLIASNVDVIAMAANTPHVYYTRLIKLTDIPIISIVDETAKETSALSFSKKAGLLGTMQTMEGSFYPEVCKKYGLEIYTPDKSGRRLVNHIIYDELVRGIIHESSKKRLCGLINKMIRRNGIDTRG